MMRLLRGLAGMLATALDPSWQIDAAPLGRMPKGWKPNPRTIVRTV